MKDVFVKIADFLKKQIEIEKVELLDEEMGNMCYITLTNGQKLLLSLMDAKI